jgi:hypothetical protein
VRGRHAQALNTYASTATQAKDDLVGGQRLMTSTAIPHAPILCRWGVGGAAAGVWLQPS